MRSRSHFFGGSQVNGRNHIARSATIGCHVTIFFVSILNERNHIARSATIGGCATLLLVVAKSKRTQPYCQERNHRSSHIVFIVAQPYYLAGIMQPQYSYGRKSHISVRFAQSFLICQVGFVPHSKPQPYIRNHTSIKEAHWRRSHISRERDHIGGRRNYKCFNFATNPFRMFNQNTNYGRRCQV